MKLELLIPPPIVALLCAALIWGAGIVFAQFNISSNVLSWVGLIMIGLGLLIDVVSALLFMKRKTTINPMKPGDSEKLVTDGFYTFTRNPMYLGLLFILIGIALRTGSLFAMPILVGFVAYLTQFQIKPEEKALEETFGDEFRDYLNRVRRWL